MLRFHRSIGLVAALFALASTIGCASRRPAERPGSQMAFGVRMAERGLWSEAAFRFEQAHRIDPGNARVLNNLAVAYEATGRFDDALAAYREAVKVDPGNRQLKQNYSRFLEFYQAFKPKPAKEAAKESGP